MQERETLLFERAIESFAIQSSAQIWIQSSTMLHASTCALRFANHRGGKTLDSLVRDTPSSPPCELLFLFLFFLFQNRNDKAPFTIFTQHLTILPKLIFDVLLQQLRLFLFDTTKLAPFARHGQIADDDPRANSNSWCIFQKKLPWREERWLAWQTPACLRPAVNNITCYFPAASCAWWERPGGGEGEQLCVFGGRPCFHEQTSSS